MAETAAKAVQRLRRAFDMQGQATAPLDARLLVQAALHIDHAALIADPDRPVSTDEEATLRDFLNRRLAHEPVSRILGRREFYGRDFLVTPDVLDPRPDTETIIDLCLTCFPRSKDVVFADLGSGSGAIAITLLAENPKARGVATDVSRAALLVAGRNAERLGVAARLQLIESDWLEAVEGRFDLIVSNPPYITASDIAALAPEVRNHDPHLALSGGSDGLSSYRRIAKGAPRRLADGGVVIVEAGQGQAAEIVDIFKQAGFRKSTQVADIAGIPRAIALWRD